MDNLNIVPIGKRFLYERNNLFIVKILNERKKMSKRSAEMTRTIVNERDENGEKHV